MAIQDFIASHFEMENLKLHKFGNYFVRKPDLNLERCSWLKYAINLLVCAPVHPKLKFHIKLARDGSNTIKYLLDIFFKDACIFFNATIFSTNIKVKLHTILNYFQSWKKCWIEFYDFWNFLQNYRPPKYKVIYFTILR